MVNWESLTNSVNHNLEEAILGKKHGNGLCKVIRIAKNHRMNWVAAGTPVARH